MSEWTEVPEWVWDLLDALAAYEDEHPILYRMTDEAAYERWSCFGAYLSERKAWPPREVRDAAEFRRHIRRELTPQPDHDDAAAVDGGAG